MRSPRTRLSAGPLTTAVLTTTLLTTTLLTPVLSAQNRDESRPDLSKITPPAIDDARFEALSKLLTPDPDAPWRSVAWRIDLLAAQREAASAQRPLFLWAMDGHPLGCT